jgi:mono/diheme cytochrome c family protein
MNPSRKCDAEATAEAIAEATFPPRPRWLLALLPLSLVIPMACGSNRAPRTTNYGRTPAGSASPDGGAAAEPPLAPECLPARTAELLPARTSVTSTEAKVASGGRTVFVRDLFGLFKTHCGQCHVDGNQGNFQLLENTFVTGVTAKVFDSIKSDDPAKYMPPMPAKGKPYSQRDENDPVRKFVELLELWKAAGQTSNPFTIASPEAEADAQARFLVSPEIGAALTNLGNCIPNRSMVGTATAKMEEMDAFFAKASELPERLEQTDFVALDSETLARNGVVSFAPAYPLWSDGAGKMRYVRLPRGKSITFDKATQQFSIPENTRFYKTFLKKIIDRDGREVFRKIETRLIVTRQDRKLDDGTVETQALAGSYVWNETETEALLLREPLRDGKPFTDLMLTYIVDEPKVQQIKDSSPPSLQYALEVANPGVLRRYAVPGSGRCRECHMGSPSASFSLGFTPLQIRRRPLGEGGTIEPSGEDELTQLGRLIDYGVVTGLASPDEVLPLEKSQGAREPRNSQELTAQGYMLGNCAGCHNPRGFPTMKNTELRDLLNFLPTATDGGIFQFPLERTSPRIKRGPNLDEPIPYITPSLRDLPRTYEDYPEYPPIRKPKWEWVWYESYGENLPTKFIPAPWRSLIYRNVDAPFSYSDDLAIFPHMPRNTPGFDCRAPRIMAEWMVSIPAERKNPELSEDAVPGVTDAKYPKPDLSAQPYVEIKKGDPRYPVAAKTAEFRVDEYKKGSRYSYCPDAVDIVDPRAETSPERIPPDLPVADDKGVLVRRADGVPDRPHWVVTDLTDAPVDWQPRRFDWDKVLVPEKLADKALTPAQKENKNGDFTVYRAALQALSEVRVSKQLRDFALKEVPFGLWKARPDCADKLASVPKVSSIPAEQRPGWIAQAKAPPEAPLYMSSPGAAVFNFICINCHGPKADSRGLQADTLADLTGGTTRVANLRDGLLGKSLDGRSNIDRIFGPAAGLYPKGTPDAKFVSAEDWAARYVAWMGLGGTLKVIPQPVLNNVGAARIMGETRKNFTASVSANMLQAAQVLCRNAIPHTNLLANPIELTDFYTTGKFSWAGETALVEQNGDANLWVRLCSIDNRKIVRVARDNTDWNPTQPRVPVLKSLDSYYWADGLPADAPVMDQFGKITSGIKEDNLFAVCAEKPTDPKILELISTKPVGPGGQPMPFCPDSLFERDAGTGNEKWRLGYDEENLKFDGVDGWSARGAINAGVAVMLYLDQIQKGAPPTLPYDQCQQLSAGAPPSK